MTIVLCQQERLSPNLDNRKTQRYQLSSEQGNIHLSKLQERDKRASVNWWQMLMVNQRGICKMITLLQYINDS